MELSYKCLCFFSLFFSNSALIRPHISTTTIQTELRAGRREGGLRVVHYGHSSFRRYIVNGSLMATVAMATLLEQLLPTTSQKIRDVIFEDKTSLKANTEFLHRRKTGTRAQCTCKHIVLLVLPAAKDFLFQLVVASREKEERENCKNRRRKTWNYQNALRCRAS